MEAGSHFRFAPKYSVFLSYPGHEGLEVAFPLSRKITACGATVFLDELARLDPESDILNALNFADEVLILVTPGPTGGSILKSLDRRLMWLALGAACARRIPIRYLLKGIDQECVVKDKGIPGLIREGHLYEDEESYLARLRSAIQMRARRGLLGLVSNRIFAFATAETALSSPRSQPD